MQQHKKIDYLLETFFFVHVNAMLPFIYCSIWSFLCQEWRPESKNRSKKEMKIKEILIASMYVIFLNQIRN